MNTIHRTLEHDEPLPPPGIHAAAHYAAFLQREAHQHQEPKAGALRNAARMINVLVQEVGRLHRELIETEDDEVSPVYQFRKECCADWYDGYPEAK